MHFEAFRALVKERSRPFSKTAQMVLVDSFFARLRLLFQFAARGLGTRGNKPNGK